MRNASGTRTPAVRRLEMILVAIGALLVSSGLALVAAPTAATTAKSPPVQHQPVGVCHATSSDTHAYVFVVVDNDSVKLQGHLRHKTDPNKHWKSVGTWNDTEHVVGDAMRDYIGSYTDEAGVFHQEDGTLTEQWCEAGSEVGEAVADVDFYDPDCANGNVGTFQADGDHATFEVTSSTPASQEGTFEPGSGIEVVATADDGFLLAGERSTQTFSWTYGPPEVGCTAEPPVVEPPVVEPPVVEAPVEGAVVIPTVVASGLAGETTATGVEAMALLAAGLLLLAGGGGLVLRTNRDGRGS